MNKYILKVMRYIDNPELFSVEEMRESADAAAYAASAYAAYTASAYAANVNVANAANAAYAYAHAATVANAYTASDAAYAANVNAANAKHWINEYFKRSGENKQDYIKEVERLK